MDMGDRIPLSSEERVSGESEPPATTQEEEEDGAATAPSPQLHWCYQCNKEVAVESAGDDQGMVCVDCRSGFVEIMTTAQAVPDVRRAQRRRRHLGSHGHGHRGASLAEALDHLYPQQLMPQQLMQVLQLLGQASHTSTQPPSPVQLNAASQLDAPTVRDVPIHGRESFQRLTEAALNGTEFAPELSVEDEGLPSLGTLPVGDGGQEGGGDAAREQDREQIRVTRVGVVNPRSLLVREQVQEGAEPEDSESDADTEAMRLELEGWDSLDEEEWEEVDENDSETGAEPLSAGEHAGEPLEQPRQGRRRRAREIHNLQVRTRTIENTLHHYLQDLLQNLVGQNIEVRVELPQGGNPLYVGNPGDYVDARGFEQLLQQMAESDNSRRGAPPASKSAIEALPTVFIERVHLDEGTAVCAVCKDVVALGEPAKQLPCLHLYHYDCILPWLSARNTCPVCRYELPTDDPDYEHQRHGRPNVSSQDGGLAARQSGDVSARDGGQQQGGDGQGNMESLEAVDGQEEDFGAENAAGAGSDGGTSGGPRGWFLLSAGPVLSMMGVVLMLCLRNHLMGRSLEVHGGHHMERQPRFFQEPHLGQMVGGSHVHSRSRWWMPFQR